MTAAAAVAERFGAHRVHRFESESGSRHSMHSRVPDRKHLRQRSHPRSSGATRQMGQWVARFQHEVQSN